ncbi:hypothetical protein ACHQM5_012153 [Ranunculus cassubicifolius]
MRNVSERVLLSRRDLVEFLIQSSLKLGVSPIVKYTSLSLFADRFLPSLILSNNSRYNWLLQHPFRESNIQLFALISIWISTKIHNTPPLSVKTFKTLGDEVINDQHFTTRDFVQAEVIFMQAIRFEIGALNTAFFFLQDYVLHFRQLAKVGDLLNFDACMDVIDLLYETDEISAGSHSPSFLAAAVLVVAYIITVPKQQWEFPILPWVKFVTSYEVEDIEELVRNILHHILKQPQPL